MNKLNCDGIHLIIDVDASDVLTSVDNLYDSHSREETIVGAGYMSSLTSGPIIVSGMDVPTLSDKLFFANELYRNS